MMMNPEPSIRAKPAISTMAASRPGASARRRNVGAPYRSRSWPPPRAAPRLLIAPSLSAAILWRGPRLQPRHPPTPPLSRAGGTMGFFGALSGSPDNAVMSSPLIGRGEVLGVQMSGMALQVGNGLTERKCTISLKVMLDGQQPYEAQAIQRIQEI